MRIKSVLRDKEILQMEPSSRERIVAAVEKNLGRVVNISSLLKVMGMKFDERLELMKHLDEIDTHVWLGNEGEQHVIYLSREKMPAEEEFQGYQWK